MLERFRNREDTEHEQALIRFAVGVPMVVYLFAMIGWSSLVGGENNPTSVFILVFFIGATAILAWLILFPEVSPCRRYAGILLDTTCSTAILYLHGETAGPVFVVYLWVTFGNGFRYGKRYLLVSTVLSAIGFGVASEFGKFNGVAEHLRYGLLVGLLVLPLYVNSFLTRLTNALEQARAGEQAKTRFLSNVSHEIRTPLTAMLGLSEQLLNSPLSAKNRRYASMIHESSQNLLEILNTILDLSKLQNHEIKIIEEEFLLGEALENLLDMQRERVRVDGLQMTLEIAPLVPAAIRCDRVRLMEVLANLLSNAIKFTPAGSVRLLVGPSPDKPDGWLRFTVADTGIGISKEALSKLFVPFSQADDSTSRKFGGTGLGLAISRELARAMGGEVTLESEPEKGTTVWVDLPVQSADAEALRKAQSINLDQLGAPPSWSKVPHVLVAEDVAFNRELLKAVLESYGCRASFAEDGARALAQMEASGNDPFDLVLMDCHMPNMDGYEATRAIRRTEQGRTLPIIALTADLEPNNRDKCLDAGMNGFITKPYRRHDMYKVLAECLGGNATSACTDLPSEQSPSRPIPHEFSKIIHDMNNLLTAVQGVAEILSLSVGDPKAKRLTNHILNATEKMTALVGELQKAPWST